MDGQLLRFYSLFYLFVGENPPDFVVRNKCRKDGGEKSFQILQRVYLFWKDFKTLVEFYCYEFFSELEEFLRLSFYSGYLLIHLERFFEEKVW